MLLELRAKKKVLDAPLINNGAKFPSEFSKLLLLTLIIKGGLEVVHEVQCSQSLAL